MKLKIDKALSAPLAFLFCLCLTVAQAQTTTPAKTTKKPPVAKTATTPAKTTTATAGPLKKNGTPDMRYKANKTAPVGPTKKDGTPDMRYKANKTAAAAKKTGAK